MKQRYVTLLAAASLVFAIGGAGAQEAAKAKMDPNLAIEAQSNADTFRVERDRSAIPRDYVQQPPLIPHSVSNYKITMNFNKCMDCHSWAQYLKAGAVKVSLTHFKDREGTDLSNISPRRYFCLQCHVPQTETRPLVESTFKRADGLRR
jgi:nitrate reductase (cytochrome), electron transfer subunit